MLFDALRSQLHNDQNGEYLNSFLKHWAVASTASMIPSLVGLQSHPEVIELDCQTGVKRHMWIKLMSKLLYHADLGAQYADLPEAALEHKLLRKKKDEDMNRALKHTKPKPMPLCQETIEKHAFLHHVRTLHSRHHAYSLHLPAGPAEAWPDALQAREHPREDQLVGAIRDDKETFSEPRTAAADGVAETFFSIIDHAANVGKYMQSTIDAHMKPMGNGDMAVAVFPSRPSCRGRPCIVAQPRACGAVQSHILRFLDASFGTMREMASWKEAKLFTHWEAGVPVPWL